MREAAALRRKDRVEMRITTQRLCKAGFVLTDCSDGRFWVMEQGPGDGAERMAAVCRLFVEDMDEGAVAEDIVLQCDSDFKDPVLYRDGFLWKLAPRDFADIVARLTRRQKSK